MCFQGWHSPLNNQFMRSSLQKSTGPTPSFPQWPAFSVYHWGLVGFSHPLWHPRRLRGTGHDHSLVYEVCRRTLHVRTAVSKLPTWPLRYQRDDTQRHLKASASEGRCLVRRKLSSCGERRTRRLGVWGDFEMYKYLWAGTEEAWKTRAATGRYWWSRVSLSATGRGNVFFWQMRTSFASFQGMLAFLQPLGILP